MSIILASSSPFRKTILQKLAIPFSCVSPNIDETALNNETPAVLVSRLSRLKAQAVPATDDDYVISSDQVAVFNGKILGKPHTVENATEQLKLFSGQPVDFITGLCLRKGNNYQSIVDTFTVHFKTLSALEIAQYIEIEKPLNCAGSFKSEGLGILLFSRLEGKDPNSLVGLPLIALNQLFLNLGVNLLTDFPRTSPAIQ